MATQNEHDRSIFWWSRPLWNRLSCIDGVKNHVMCRVGMGTGTAECPVWVAPGVESEETRQQVFNFRDSAMQRSARQRPGLPPYLPPLQSTCQINLLSLQKKCNSKTCTENCRTFQKCQECISIPKHNYRIQNSVLFSPRLSFSTLK